jgi:hypothetical protein
LERWGLGQDCTHCIASGEKIHGIGKKVKMEAVYKHCVKDPQIERHFHAEMRALARTTAAAALPVGESPQEPPTVDARATGDGPDYLDADVGHVDGEAGVHPEGMKSAKRARRMAPRRREVLPP